MTYCRKTRDNSTEVAWFLILNLYASQWDLNKNLNIRKIMIYNEVVLVRLSEVFFSHPERKTTRSWHLSFSLEQYSNIDIVSQSSSIQNLK